MTTTELDPHDGLVQVRTAYRLLNAYHRRLLDLAIVTRDAVKERFGNLPKAWWYRSHFTMPPKGSNDPTSRWAYDFIALQDAAFVWASTNEPSNGGFYFAIGHTPDSATEDLTKFEGEPDPIKLDPVTQARSYLEAWVVATTPCDSSSWDDFQSKRIVREKRIEDLWWTDRKVRTLEAHGTTIAIGGFNVDIATVWTLAAAKDNFIDPLLTLIANVSSVLPANTGPIQLST